MRRPLLITLACIMEIVAGIFEIIIGVVIFAGGLLVNRILEQLGLDFLQWIALYGIWIIGVMILIWGMFDVIASIAMWKLRKWGAYIAVVLSSLSVMISLALLIVNPASIIDIVYSGLIIIFVVVGWKRIKTSAVPITNDTDNKNH